MKKDFVSFFTGIFISWLFASVANGQITNGIARVSNQPSSEKIIPESKQLHSNVGTGISFRNDINTKAVRNFIRDYKNVSDAKWVKLDNGFSFVFFSLNGIYTRLLYNKKGDCECLIRDYFEDKLPREIRHLVKSTYYDFSIYHINEVTTNGKTAYIIKMEDKTTWKTIRVADNEMEVREEFLKK
jgi:hypothetical protein